MCETCPTLAGVSDEQRERVTESAAESGTVEQSPQFDRRSPLWQRVSPKYAIADLITNLIMAAILTAGLVVLVIVTDNTGLLWLKIGIAALAVIDILYALFAFRRVKAIGYLLREDDLLFRRGIMFERIVAVPYGRLQLVDITRGPVLRALGLATLKFVTASATTGVNLPGLPLAEAEELRDRLVALAETRRSGL